MQRISTGAYATLRESLPVICWYRKTFEHFVRTALRDCPSALARLNFSLPKREVADQLVDLLAENEAKYRDSTLSLMRDIAALRSFPDIDRVQDSAKRDQLKEAAHKAVGEMKEVLRGTLHDWDPEESARKAEQQAAVESNKKQWNSVQQLDDLQSRFLQLHDSSDPQARGAEFENLLHDLFDICDLEPRFGYIKHSDQIDGSFTCDTDDYIIEAKWLTGPVGRDQADIFANKIRRNGKNSLGLFISVNGYTKGFQETYSTGTPFITMDGSELMIVLRGDIRLEEAIRQKKRYANETGSCYCPLAG